MSAVPMARAAAVRVAPGRPPAQWSVRVPGSKSLTNRALLLAGVAAGTTRLVAPLIADDTEVMMAALRVLGAPVDRVAGGDGEDVVVEGLGGPPGRRHREWSRSTAAWPGPSGGSWCRCSPPVAAVSRSTVTRNCAAGRSARCSPRCAPRAR